MKWDGRYNLESEREGEQGIKEKEEQLEQEENTRYLDMRTILIL